MRSRNIKPGFFKNEDLAECSLYARLLFIGLWCMADREGRLEKRPLRIKAEVFPYDSLDIHGELTVLERKGLVVTYVVDGKEFLHIVNFKEHQAPHHTEAKSKLPDMTRENVLTVNSPLTNGEYPPDSLIPDSLIHKPTTTTATRAEIAFRECFAQNEKRIRELYPHTDYEAEKETCIAHYRSGSPPIDCYPVILKWFQRIPKPKTASREPPKTFEQIKLDNTKRAMTEFLEEQGYGTAGHDEVHGVDRGVGGSISLRYQQGDHQDLPAIPQ